MEKYIVYEVLDVVSEERMLLQAAEFKKMRPVADASATAPEFQGVVDDGVVPFVGLTWMRRVNIAKQTAAMRKQRRDAKQAELIRDKRHPRRYGFKVGKNGKLQATSLAEAAKRAAEEEKRKAEERGRLRRVGFVASHGADEGKESGSSTSGGGAGIRAGADVLNFRGPSALWNCLEFERQDGTLVRAKLLLGGLDPKTRSLGMMLWKRRNKKFVGKPFQMKLCSLRYAVGVSVQAAKLAQGEGAALLPRKVRLRVLGTFYEPPMAAVVLTATVPGAIPGEDLLSGDYPTTGFIPIQVSQLSKFTCAINMPNPDGGISFRASGVLIADHLVLTWAHMFRKAPASAATFSFARWAAPDGGETLEAEVVDADRRAAAYCKPLATGAADVCIVFLPSLTRSGPRGRATRDRVTFTPHETDGTTTYLSNGDEELTTVRLAINHCTHEDETSTLGVDLPIEITQEEAEAARGEMAAAEWKRQYRRDSADSLSTAAEIVEGPTLRSEVAPEACGAPFVVGDKLVGMVLCLHSTRVQAAAACAPVPTPAATEAVTPSDTDTAHRGGIDGRGAPSPSEAGKRSDQGTKGNDVGRSSSNDSSGKVEERKEPARLSMEVMVFESLTGEIDAVRQLSGKGSAVHLWFKNNLWMPAYGRRYPNRLVLEPVTLPASARQWLDKIAFSWNLDNVMPPKLYRDVRLVGDYLNNPEARKGNMPEDIGPFTSCRIERVSVITLPESELLPRGLCVCRQHRNDGECPVLRQLLVDAQHMKDPRWTHILDSMGPEVKAAIDTGDRDNSFLLRWFRGYHLQFSHREMIKLAVKRILGEQAEKAKIEAATAAAAKEAKRQERIAAGQEPDSSGADSDSGKEEENDVEFVIGPYGSTHGVFALRLSYASGLRKRDPVFASFQAQWGAEFTREGFRAAFKASVNSRLNLRLQWGAPEVLPCPYVVVSDAGDRYDNELYTRSVQRVIPAAGRENM